MSIWGGIQFVLLLEFSPGQKMFFTVKYWWKVYSLCRARCCQLEHWLKYFFLKSWWVLLTNWVLFFCLFLIHSAVIANFLSWICITFRHLCLDVIWSCCLHILWLIYGIFDHNCSRLTFFWFLDSIWELIGYGLQLKDPYLMII